LKIIAVTEIFIIVLIPFHHQIHGLDDIHKHDNSTLDLF
jgi:hypothetical protein